MESWAKRATPVNIIWLKYYMTKKYKQYIKK